MRSRTGVMTADKASIKACPHKGILKCACVLYVLDTRLYGVTIHKSNSTVCCLFHLHHFHESTMNKGRWQHWSKDIYESLAVKWRALTFLLLIQCSHFCSYSLVCVSLSLKPMLFFWTPIKGEMLPCDWRLSKRHLFNVMLDRWKLGTKDFQPLW